MEYHSVKSRFPLVAIFFILAIILGRFSQDIRATSVLVRVRSSWTVRSPRKHQELSTKPEQTPSRQEEAPPIEAEAPLKQEEAPPQNQTAKRERVALCIAGNARTFHHNVTHSLLLANVANHLRVNYTTDVFFVIKFEDAPRADLLSADASKEKTQAAIQTFDPVEVYYPNDKATFTSERLIPDDGVNRDLYKIPEGCEVNQPTKVRFPHTLYRANQCMDRIEAYERKKGVRYDWVYRFRADMVLLDPVPLPSVLRTDTFYSNAGILGCEHQVRGWWKNTGNEPRPWVGIAVDHFALCSRQIASVALRALAALDDCQAWQLPLFVYPEALQFFYLLKHNVSTNMIRHDWILIRDQYGPECFRMKDITAAGFNWQQSMHRCYKWADDYVDIFPRYLEDSSRAH